MTYRNKIVVIADDFTGAAEIGGIGLRHGIKVAIETEPIENTEADLLVIATDTRSMDKKQASEFITQLTEKILQYNPSIVYKKIDSVMRGNISEELVAQMKVMKKQRSVIIAANPVFKRIIKEGQYYIDQIPLNRTLFSDDSQYPIITSDVVEILSKIDGYKVVNCKPDEILPDTGLIIGDVENTDDLRKWAFKYNANTLFAGASGFFNSLLVTLNITNGENKSAIQPFGKNALFVLGSSYPKDSQLLSNMSLHGHYFSNMPYPIYNQTYYPLHLIDNWVEDIVTNMEKYNKVIMASMYSDNPEPGLSFRIKRVVADVVKKVSDRININELLIEGGSTTSEVLDRLHIKKLIPIQEIDTGVIRMKVENNPDLCLTTKPGSYLWPENVWLPDKIVQMNNENLVF